MKEYIGPGALSKLCTLIKAELNNQDVFSRPQTLTAAVAALYGLPATAVPNDVFLAINSQKGDCYIETGSFYTPGGFNDQCTLSTAHRPLFLFLSNGGHVGALPLVFCLRDCSVAQISLVGSTTNLNFTQNAATWTDNSVQFKLTSPYDAIWRYFILSKAV